MEEEQAATAPKSKLENFLSGCLAFVILIFGPIIVIGIILSIPSDADPPKPSWVLNRPRQRASKQTGDAIKNGLGQPGLSSSSGNLN
jgi:hypothetical protein